MPNSHKAPLPPGTPLPASFKAATIEFVEAQIPFNKFLGMKCTLLRPGFGRLELPSREEFTGDPYRPALHGGVISSALDTVAGLAVMLKMGHEKPQATAMAHSLEFARISTLDLRVDYLQPGRGKSFIASAVVIRLGTRVANVQMMLHNDGGSCIATGAAAFMLHAIRSDA